MTRSTEQETIKIVLWIVLSAVLTALQISEVSRPSTPMNWFATIAGVILIGVFISIFSKMAKEFRRQFNWP